VPRGPKYGRAVRLAEAGVPFLFYTGKLGTDELLAAWPGHKVVTKPADAKALVLLSAGGSPNLA